MQGIRNALKNYWQLLNPLSNLDWPLAALLLVLSGFGLTVLYSASGQSNHVVVSQLSHLLIGFASFYICSKLRPQHYELLAPFVYLGVLLLLIAVMGIGHVDKGARRWLNLGIIKLQPSELMKIALPLMLAALFSRIQQRPEPKLILTALVIIALPFLLVMKQPDLGTAIMIAASGAIVILLSGIPLRYIIIGVGMAMAAAPVGWHFLHGYQKNRLLTFLNPQHDRLGTGYHIIQSKIAIGSGGITGKGFLHGTQAHLQFLPERSTDFIFSVLGEEFGLIGCLFLLSLFMAIFMRVIWLCGHTNNRFSRLLMVGIVSSFMLEGIVNIGMVSGILPVVGVPLPFVSYGGSAIMTLGAGFGIICSLQSQKTLW